MTKDQLNEIVAIINNDCRISKRYIDDAGDTCAIGALALAAGITPEDLKVMNNSVIWVHENEGTVSAIELRFGLNLSNQSVIQSINDDLYEPERRRESIVNYLTSQYELDHQPEQEPITVCQP